MAVMTRIWILLIIVLAQVRCTTVQHISNTKVSYTPVSSTTTSEADKDITAMIVPYKEKLDAEMSEVLGNLSQEMTKSKPESTLSNWFSDAMLAAARKVDPSVDFAISNYGGLRMPSLSAGPLTRGELYELCPFDNLILIVDVPGNILDTFLQHTAEADGWPVSHGIRMIIKDKKMISCTIGGRAIDAGKTYKVAMPDYVANGGDEMSILIPLSRKQTDILQRDALIEYAREISKGGKDISAAIEGRIIKQ
jgi:2',3'-cyclic-nucleotide 2'-phosphodiesterase (5'-nucleotidase family)